MQELIAAKPADLLSTYFRKALPFHPDVAEDREKAYWRLAAGSSVVPQDFSEQAILELWLREFAFEESGLELPALIAKELQMSTALEREQRHYEACTLARGLIPGERLQCAICGFQVRYHEQMREHMGEHEGLRGFWADRAIKLSTQSLGRAGASDDSTFQLSDGSWVQFKDLPDVQLPELDTIQPDEVAPRHRFCVGFEKYDQASQRTWSPKVTQTFLQHYAMWRCLHLQIGPAEIRQEPPADVDEFRTGADVDLAAVPRLL